MWYFGMLGTCYPMVYHPWVVRNIFNSYSMSPFPWMWATFYHDLQMHISLVTPYSYVRPGIQWCTTIEWSETFWAMWQLLLHCLFMKWPCDPWSLMTLWFCFTLFLFWSWHLKVEPLLNDLRHTEHGLHLCLSLPSQHHLTQPEVTLFKTYNFQQYLLGTNIVVHGTSDRVSYFYQNGLLSIL